MNHLVEASWLVDHLYDEDVRVVDCRFDLMNGALGREHYETGHIPNALYFNLDTDLSGEVGEHGGRHPLPNLELFIERLSDAGIDQETKVVVYDSEGAMASRFWWMLTYLGHENVYVLNGGFPNWAQQGFPITSDIPVFTRKNFIAYPNHDLLVMMEDVKNRIESDDDFTLIDAREPARYEGLQEPIDAKAGHIPTAKNYFWKMGIQDGFFLTAEEQEKRFAALDKEKETIVYCGSGVTACPNILALYQAGFTNVKLYSGSFSDWISYKDNEIIHKQNV